MRTVLVRVAGLMLATSALVGACGDAEANGRSSAPGVVVTTSVLGDVVRNLVGEELTVDVLVPAGTEAHAFAPSPKQVVRLREAELLITNGRGLEEGLQDAIDAARADGVTVVEATDHLHEPRASDPHFFTDPRQVMKVVRGLQRDLRDLDAVDQAALDRRVVAYLGELEALDQALVELLDPISNEHRLLVTSHNVFAHFAERYGFEVDSVAPAGDALGEPGPARLDRLARLVASRGLPAVFSEVGGSSELVDAVAAEVGGVQVVELYGETLGPRGSGADTYLTMMQTNAERIAAALG